MNWFKRHERGQASKFTIYIGIFNKPKGETLNLHKCHSLVCLTVHDDITYCHDSIKEVIYTRCIFNHIKI